MNEKVAIKILIIALAGAIERDHLERPTVVFCSKCTHDNGVLRSVESR